MQPKISPMLKGGFAWTLLALSTAIAITTPCPGEEPPGIYFSSNITPSLLAEKRSAYRETLGELAKTRERLEEKHAAAQNTKSRSQVLQEAQNALIEGLLSDVFPAWDGTAWDFNGISEEPGKGAIACGYFVTTTLRDAGLKLPRIKLAQQPSQTIIRSLCVKETIRVYYDKPLETVLAYLKTHGPGIYIVGLDCHTGFVVNHGDQMSFVHASYFRPPRAVIAEPLDGDNPLKRSKYRMIGKLFGDELVGKWLMQENIEMKKTSRQ